MELEAEAVEAVELEAEAVEAVELEAETDPNTVQANVFSVVVLGHHP